MDGDEKGVPDPSTQNSVSFVVVGGIVDMVDWSGVLYFRHGERD